MPLILEGLATTVNPDGSVNASPMGPIVDENLSRLVMRPFQTSRTYQNLKRVGRGVFHVTDDVEMIVEGALGDLKSLEVFPAEKIEGWVISSACRWYEFEVVSLQDHQPRTRIECRVVHGGRLRDFFGFNRAKHAVLEAAILATRVHLSPRPEIASELTRLQVIVEKTAGEAEVRAFRRLVDHIANQPDSTSADG